LQPRDLRPGGRRGLDPHVLGQPEHAEGHRGHLLRAGRRALHGARARRRVDLEFKDNDPLATAKLFDRYGGKLPKKVALGMVSHRTLQVESPDEVAADIRTAMEHIDPEHIVVTSNCGFGRQGFNRLVAFYKSTSLAQG